MINALYKDPLHADIGLLRTMTDHGSWVRPHARLPLHPPFDPRETEPLTLEEISTAFSEMKRWTKRKTFDSYFCAGEMTAAFCEVLRLVHKRLAVTSPATSGEILREAQKLYFELLHRLVDTSDGVHVFPKAHLEEIYETLKALTEKNGELEKYLQEFEAHREDY